jgi:hypothetical protein
VVAGAGRRRTAFFGAKVFAPSGRLSAWRGRGAAGRRTVDEGRGDGGRFGGSFGLRRIALSRHDCAGCLDAGRCVCGESNVDARNSRGNKTRDAAALHGLHGRAKPVARSREAGYELNLRATWQDRPPPLALSTAGPHGTHPSRPHFCLSFNGDRASLLSLS